MWKNSFWYSTNRTLYLLQRIQPCLISICSYYPMWNSQLQIVIHFSIGSLYNSVHLVSGSSFNTLKIEIFYTNTRAFLEKFRRPKREQPSFKLLLLFYIHSHTDLWEYCTFSDFLTLVAEQDTWISSNIFLQFEQNEFKQFFCSNPLIIRLKILWTPALTKLLQSVILIS